MDHQQLLYINPREPCLLDAARLHSHKCERAASVHGLLQTAQVNHYICWERPGGPHVVLVTAANEL